MKEYDEEKTGPEYPDCIGCPQNANPSDGICNVDGPCKAHPRARYASEAAEQSEVDEPNELEPNDEPEAVDLLEFEMPDNPAAVTAPVEGEYSAGAALRLF